MLIIKIMQAIQRFGQLAATQYGRTAGFKTVTRFNPTAFCAPMQVASFSKKGTKFENKVVEVDEKDEAKEISTMEKIKAALTLIKRVQRSPEIKYMCNDAVPVDLEGSMPLPLIPQR